MKEINSTEELQVEVKKISKKKKKWEKDNGR